MRRKVILYSRSDRDAGIVEDHNRQLFDYLKSHGIQVAGCYWEAERYSGAGLTPELARILLSEPGIVSVSRSHWKTPGRSSEIIDSVGYDEWMRRGCPGFNDQAVPDPVKIGRQAQLCLDHGCIPFSRNQLLQVDGTFAPWEVLRGRLDQFFGFVPAVSG